MTSTTMKPIPDNVKDILKDLSGPQQVAIRSYIASLRSEIKELNEQLLTNHDDDPHAHYHGHEKCTADHGHQHHHREDDDTKKEEGGHHHHHEHEHVHDEHCHHEHDHQHDEHCHHDHEHQHDEHCHHDHVHNEHCEHNKDDHDMKEESSSGGGEGHHHHEHEHRHGHKHGHDDTDQSPQDAKDDDDTAGSSMPAWKKKAMSSDPMAAPFGGSWNTESNISASKASDDHHQRRHDQMEE